MKQNNITIKSRLNKIEIEEKTIEKIGKFLKTKKGQMFVSRMDREDIKALCVRINAPKFILLYSNNTKNKNLIRAAIKKYNITFPEHKPIPITAPQKIKIKIYLTKKEQKEIAARQPKKWGFAAQMHAYEEYAMEKFKKKKPAPTERQLKEDLFPDELIAGYNNILNIRREYVRNLLCKKYGDRTNRERFFRIFKVLSVKNDPATGKEHKPVISEVELDSPFIVTENMTKKDISTKLKMLADSAREADSNVIRVKLYTKYGDLVRSVNFVRKLSQPNVVIVLVLLV